MSEPIPQHPGKAVFLSYASQDSEPARRIADALRAAGVEVWLDADGGLEQGDEWDAKIRKQIKECVLFVPIVSANTQARLEGYFRIEWDLAAERARGIASGVAFILPVVIDDTREPDALVPDRFRAVQWTRLAGGEVPPEVQQRFLKLWSHRVGVVSHEVAQASSLQPDEMAGWKPALRQGRSNRRPWLVPAILGAVVVAVGAVLWLERDPAKNNVEEVRSPISESSATEDARLVAQVWKLLYDHGMARAQLDSADQLCRRAAEIAPTNPDVWAAWSHVNTWFVFHRFDASTTRREAARDYAARAMQFAPKSFEARLAQAFYWHRGGSVIESQLRTAKEMLRELNGERPDDPRVLLHLGTLLLRNAEDWEAGREMLERLGEGTSLAAVALMELGYNLHFDGRYSDAERAIDRSIAAGAYWNNLALKARLALYWHGDLEAAKAWMARMPPADMQEDFAVAAKFDVDLWSREPEQAIRLLLAHPRDWLDSNPYDGPRALLLGEARLMAGREESARRDFQLALELTESRLRQDPNDARLLQHKAVALHFLGDQDGAGKAYRQSRDNGLSSRSLERLSMLLQPSEELLDSLEAGFDTPTQLTTAAGLRLNPRLDRLRANPRFQVLLARAEASPLHTPNPTRESAPSAAVSDAKSVAVLPFENRSAGGEDAAFLADGIQEDLINTLSRVPGLKVIARTAVVAYRGGATPLPQIATALHVSHLVEAGVQRAGDRVRINVQLIRASDGEAVWSERYDRTLSATNIFDLQEEITSAVADTLQLRLGVKSGEKLLTGTTGNLAAYERFLKARKEWLEGSTTKAIEMFQEAIRFDPGYALAYGGLAEAYVSLSIEGFAPAADAFPKAKAAAERALQLDDHIVQAYTALAEYAFHYDWNWEEAEKAILRALAIDPNYAVAYSRHSGHLKAWGRFEEADAAARRSKELSPAPDEIVGLASVSYQRRWQDVLDLTSDYSSPESTKYLVDRAIALLHLGHKDEALRRFERAVELDPDDVSAKISLGWAYGQASEIAKAREIVEQFKAMAGNRFVSPLVIGRVAAGMNDRDLAFAQLERAYEVRDPNLPFIGEESDYDPIRDDPRFRDLLKRLKLDVFFPETSKK